MTTGAPQKNIWLPTLGLSYIGIQNSMQYLSYSKGLEIGTMAPLIATNYGSQLPPRITEQYEIGTKHVLNSKLQVSLAGFHISKSYEYTQQNTGYYGDYIQAGKEIHQGIEASVAGQLTNTVSLNASAMLIRTKIEGTNDLFEGKSAPNVPGFASNIFVIHRIPSFDGLSLNYTVRYIGPKYANRENSARVPGYTRFDLGITEMKKTNMGLFTVRMGIENLFDKRYWADTPEFMGDTYLIPGAPRIFRATAKLDF
jgi:iron complex outermembrane receptor protein